jgi:cysteine-rich repeat protein
MEQISVCEGKERNQPCSAPGLEDGVCLDDVCLPPGCGNRALDPQEVCDDGNTQNGDGCSSDCRSDETCGNGIVDPSVGENCDDGNTVSGDGCRANCVLPACGNGVVDGESNEECDEGAANSNEPDASCRVNCLVRRCGDGVIDELAGEVCDDGNVVSGDGCRPDCQSDETCGNGLIDALKGEECDDGNSLAGDGCDSLCRSEVPNWQESRSTAPPRLGDLDAGGFVFDLWRDRLVAFGGFEQSAYYYGTSNKTYEWNGEYWSVAAPTLAPPTRRWHSTAYDSSRGVTVVFGGESEGAFYLDDTWEWNGTAWKQVISAVAPSPRSGASMTFDGARGVVVLHGGYEGQTDTWEWDGVSWTEITTSESPAGGSLAYDPTRALTVLLTFSGQTWEYDGVDWSQQSPTTGPTYPSALAYDPVAGSVRARQGTSTWVWDGVDWSAGNDSPSLPFGDWFLVTDSLEGRLLALDPEDLGSVWAPGIMEHDGTGWVEVPQQSAKPAARKDFGLVHDTANNRLILAGGTSNDSLPHRDTWAWDGIRWTPLADNSGPAQSDCDYAYDQARAEVVAFCFATDAAETWSFDGDSWALEAPATSPPKRNGFALAYDAARERTILFGGSSGTLFDDTWEWDGTTWTERAPVNRPPARDSHAMAYDPVRERVVLFGGNRGSEYAADTWEWDGDDWAKVQTSPTPPPIAEHALAYDAARRTILLFGGYDLSPQTWEYDGANWRLVQTAKAPPPRVSHKLVFDPHRNDLLAMAGVPPDSLTDVWLYDASAGTVSNVSSAAQSPGGADVAVNPDSQDALVIGYAEPFNEILVDIAVSGEGTSGPWDYWNGQDWQSLSWVSPSPQLSRPPGPSSHELEVPFNWTPMVFPGTFKERYYLRHVNNGTYTTPPVLNQLTIAAPVLIWRLRWRGRAEEVCISGTDGDSDGLTACDDPDCWGVCNSTCPPQTSCAAGAPFCGDGTCQAWESCRFCSGDCGECPAVCGDSVCSASETAGGCPGDC